MLLMPDASGLLDAVLDDRLVDERQHFLGLRLGRRAGTGCRDRRRGTRPCERHLSAWSPEAIVAQTASCDAGIGFKPHARSRVRSRTPRRGADRPPRTAASSRTRSWRPFAALDAQRRELIPEVEKLKREQNAAGEEVARAKKAGAGSLGRLRREQGARAADQAARSGARRTSSSSAPTC